MEPIYVDTLFWYNPHLRRRETIATPQDDASARAILVREEFIAKYNELRTPPEAMDIKGAMLRTGEFFYLRDSGQLPI